MKKLLFTVFAVVGFSTISVANNHVEVEKIAIILNDSCNQRQHIAVDLCVEFDCSPYESFFYGAAEWGRCMAGY